MSTSGCILVIVAFSRTLGLSAAGYGHYGHGGHGGDEVVAYKTIHGGYGHDHGHDYKIHAIKGPTFVVKTVHHIKKIHPGGGYLGHYSYGKHGHGHGGGHGGYGKVLIIKSGHGLDHGHGHGYSHRLGGGHGGYDSWW
nr:uncharacterized protein LOC126545958 [Dermacentor andersoni]